MARTNTIHHPTLLRQDKVGAGAAKAYVADGGWQYGPLSEEQKAEALRKAEARNAARKAANQTTTGTSEASGGSEPAKKQTSGKSG